MRAVLNKSGMWPLSCQLILLDSLPASPRANLHLKHNQTIHHLLNFPPLPFLGTALELSLWLQHFFAKSIYQNPTWCPLSISKMTLRRECFIPSSSWSPCYDSRHVFSSSLAAFPCSSLRYDCPWACQLLHIHVFSTAVCVLFECNT